MNTLARTFILIVLLFSIAQSNPASSTEIIPLDVKLKAAYLYNFLRFVKWPELQRERTDICVYGIIREYQSAFNAMTEISKADKEIKTRHFSIDEPPENLAECQIVFITNKAGERLASVMQYLSTVPSNHHLTIGESENFIRHGGMINFVRMEDKIRFEISTDNTRRAGLKISSKVLRIAQRVVNTE